MPTVNENHAKENIAKNIADTTTNKNNLETAHQAEEFNEGSASNKEMLQQRVEKLKQLQEADIIPYPNRYKRSHSIEEILKTFFSKNQTSENQEMHKHETSDETAQLSAAGRISAKRRMGKAFFLTIQDEKNSLQVYANNKLLNEKDFFLLQQIDLGDIIGVQGSPFTTKTGEPSLRAVSLTLLSKNLFPVPTIKQGKDGKNYGAFSDTETRYRRRYLDLAANSQVRDVFRMRSNIIKEIRNFLDARDFMEVETPMMQNIASGAAARPFVTHHNTLDMDLYLRIAPELYLKRLIVGGYEKVFEMNRNFRNEGVSTKHNPEFTMLELYQAYADYNDMMEITESLFVYLADKLLGKRKIPYGDATIDLNSPWQRKSYLEIIAEKSGADFSPFVKEKNPLVKEARRLAEQAQVECEHLPTFWEIVDEVFSQKVEHTLIQPIFITDFPLNISPLAKTKPENPYLVERFEPYISGREMGNAFSELNDPAEQQSRFEQQLELKEAGAEETIEMDADYIEALQVGMPPSGGLGLGIDRLVMLFTDSPSIKDVILFPQMRKKE